MLRGGCYCGAVRYETAASPQQRTACHCTTCRGTSGAPFVAWFSVPAGSFRIVAGEPARFRSSERATRTFCAACGTPLTFESTGHADKIDVTVCSLEDPEQAPPADHTYGRSRLSWVRLGEMRCRSIRRPAPGKPCWKGTALCLHCQHLLTQM